MAASDNQPTSKDNQIRPNVNHWKKHMLSAEQVLLQTEDVVQFATEVTQLKQNLHKVLNKKTVDAVGKIELLEAEVTSLKQWKKNAELELSQCRARCEAVVGDCQKEKQENLKLRFEIERLTQQMGQQSDYCSSLGSACCTLLWRVSRCEESIQSILVGTKVEEFLLLVSSTLVSYIEAYKEEWPQENTEETQFILALCGIITNIAASAYGRDYLITNQSGRDLIDTYINVLAEAPNGRSAQLKNLILMALYNISINQKGIKYISTKSGILGLLSWLVQDEKAIENRLNTLRLIQSMMCDESKVGIVHELLEVLPMSTLEQLSHDKAPEIRQLVLEVIRDIQDNLPTGQL